MRRIIPTLIALALALALVAVVAGQEGGLGRLQPLLVNITQSVPVEVEFVVEGTEPQTVTVPMTLDLNLQVGLSSALTPVVAVGAVAPALVSVSALQAQGEPLIDNSGIVYEIEATESVEIIQLRTDADFTDEMQLTGEIRNVSDQALKSFKAQIVLTVYDADGAILDAATGYPTLQNIAPGQTSPFTILTGAAMSDVGRYFIQFGTD